MLHTLNLLSVVRPPTGVISFQFTVTLWRLQKWNFTSTLSNYTHSLKLQPLEITHKLAPCSWINGEYLIYLDYFVVDWVCRFFFLPPPIIFFHGSPLKRTAFSKREPHHYNQGNQFEQWSMDKQIIYGLTATPPCIRFSLRAISDRAQTGTVGNKLNFSFYFSGNQEKYIFRPVFRRGDQ